jgi:hypothetical protein
VKSNRSDEDLSVSGSKRNSEIEVLSLPDDPFKLLLSDVRGHLAIDLASAKGHSQRLRHVFLYLRRDVRVLVRWANPDVGRALVLKFAAS